MLPNERRRLQIAIEDWMGPPLDENDNAAELLQQIVEDALAPRCICEWRDTLVAAQATFYCPVHPEQGPPAERR